MPDNLTITAEEFIRFCNSGEDHGAAGRDAIRTMQPLVDGRESDIFAFWKAVRKTARDTARNIKAVDGMGAAEAKKLANSLSARVSDNFRAVFPEAAAGEKLRAILSSGHPFNGQAVSGYLRKFSKDRPDFDFDALAAYISEAAKDAGKDTENAGEIKKRTAAINGLINQAKGAAAKNVPAATKAGSGILAMNGVRAKLPKKMQGIMSDIGGQIYVTTEARKEEDIAEAVLAFLDHTNHINIVNISAILPRVKDVEKMKACMDDGIKKKRHNVIQGNADKFFDDMFPEYAIGKRIMNCLEEEREDPLEANSVCGLCFDRNSREAGAIKAEIRSREMDDERISIFLEKQLPRVRAAYPRLHKEVYARFQEMRSFFLGINEPVNVRPQAER